MDDGSMDNMYGHSCLCIALISEQRSTYLDDGYSEEHCAALTHDGEIQSVLTALKDLGHDVTLVPGIQALVQHLVTGTCKEWDLVFNMAQGFHGPARESQVPALLEAYQIPFTFSDAATITLCQNKAVAKIIMNHYKIPTAPFAVIRMLEGAADLSELQAASLPYPLFVKPVTEGSSKGIESCNKLDSHMELGPALKELGRRFPDQDIVVEPFLSGREFTVSILGTRSRSRVIGIREHIWKTGRHSSQSDCHQEPRPEFASRLSKSSQDGKMLTYEDSHDMAEPQIRACCQTALKTWEAFNCQDCGRVDIRFDTEKPSSIPCVLEVNPIAGLLPGHSPLPATAEINGLSFQGLIFEIIASSLQRKSRTTTPSDSTFRYSKDD